MDVLEIKDLHARVEEKEILKGINLTIKTGEVHAIMGPNGAGKSTLFSHFNGLSEPTSGHVEIEGEDGLSGAGQLSALGVALVVGGPGVEVAGLQAHGAVLHAGQVLLCPG